MIDKLRSAHAPPPAPAPLRNVYACLVHESQECVVDLVRNLRCLDPDSSILLYDGSAGGRLLEPQSCFQKLGACIHPEPRPIDAGSVYLFAFDCLRFAHQQLAFDTLTLVDSDQLALRSGWSRALSVELERQRVAAGPVGLLGCGPGGGAPEPQPQSTRVTPAIVAWQERALWQPLLSRFEDGEAQFPRWAAWPGTVLTSSAARELARWFDSDAELRGLLARSRVFAKEQIIFPTLTALLGFRVVESPSSYAYVRQQVSYHPGDAQAALGDEQAYWMHPVARRYDDPSRGVIRSRFAQYRSSGSPRSTQIRRRTVVAVDDALCQPILEHMRDIEGWLTPAEARLLISATHQALSGCPEAQAVVEVGSYCGRATVVIGSVLRAVRATAKVWAIDPHDGFVGAHDHGLERVEPTLERLHRNVASADLSPFVEIVQARAEDVPWSEPLCLLLIDGLHDYPNVLKDFSHFEGFLVDGALIAFHDYAEYFPGVPAFVDELVASGRYEAIARARSLIVLRKALTAFPPDDD